MKTITISIGDMHHKFLSKFANGNNSTIEKYVEGIVLSWINPQIENGFIKAMKKKSYEELETIFGELKP